MSQDAPTTTGTDREERDRRSDAEATGDAGEPGATDESRPEDPAVLRARVDVLEAENERLRREYVRARTAQYRRAALALAVVGLAAVAGAVLFPDQPEVLHTLGGTGLFGAALTHFLTPERFVAASVAGGIHEAHAATRRGLAADLGLQEERVYVPAPDAGEPARLFVPQRPDYELPDDLEHVVVAADDPRRRGLAVVPTGGPLYEAFERTVTGEPATEPAALAGQLADAVVETFELAAAAAAEPAGDGDRVVLTVAGPTFGSLDAPDHPVVSVVGTGLAARLEEPVVATVEDGGDETRVAYEIGAPDREGSVAGEGGD